MSMHQQIRFELDLLKVEVEGEFSLEESKRAFLEMLGAVIQHQRVLSDRPAAWEQTSVSRWGHHATIRLEKLSR